MGQEEQKDKSDKSDDKKDVTIALIVLSIVRGLVFLLFAGFYLKADKKTEYEMLELPSAPTHTNWREMSPSPPPAPPPSTCDEGPVGDKGPKSSRGRWSG